MSSPALPGFARVSLSTAAGALVWAFHFGALYQATALACARGDTGWLRGWILLATALAVCACLELLRRRPAADADLASWLRRALALLALGAIVWQTLPVLLVARPCG